MERDADNGPSTCPVADCARALVGHVGNFEPVTMNTLDITGSEFRWLFLL